MKIAIDQKDNILTNQFHQNKTPGFVKSYKSLESALKPIRTILISSFTA